MTQKITIDGDNCYVDIHMYGDTYERKLVMTKEAFIECYNKWIVGEDGGKTDATD